MTLDPPVVGACSHRQPLANGPRRRVPTNLDGKSRIDIHMGIEGPNNEPQETNELPERIFLFVNIRPAEQSRANV
jgi:hypothetical protein